MQRRTLPLMAGSAALALVVAWTVNPIPVKAQDGQNEFQTSPNSQNTPTPAADTAPVQLDTVTISAQMEQERNSLSPTTGSSAYIIQSQDIQDLPLGTATPLNQVMLQAPGVVQDSFGQLHVRGDHANLQYRIDGVIIPESITGFGQTLDSSIIGTTRLLTGALPAQYGLRTAGIIDITTLTGKELGNGGSIGMTIGSFNTFESTVTLYGQSGRWSYFVTGNYLGNEIGIENPTPAESAIHDQSWQRRGFGELSYAFTDSNQIRFMSGATDNQFQVPNNPGQTPAYSLSGVSNYPSANLDENQHEITYFNVLTLQGKAEQTNYQLSIGQRYSEVDFNPDPIGDLIYNGVASTVGRSNRTEMAQLDMSTRIEQNQTLSYGLYTDRQSVVQNNSSLTFPTDADGNQTSDVPITIVDNNNLSESTFSGYVQDRWNVTDRLTINGGLRYDLINGYLNDNQLSPRLGMVYALTDSLSFHSGYARYFLPPSTELISATDIAAFQGTTNALPSNVNTQVQAQRTNYYDAGFQWEANDALTLGLDAYLSRSTNLLDEGQFGTALIFSDFNYAEGRNDGIEFTANYKSGPLHAYFNGAYGNAQGKDVASGQYNFSSAELAYIANNWIALDHEQKYTSSGGASWRFPEGTTVGADYLFGTGLRAGFANTVNLPSYYQINLSAMHSFGSFDVRASVINVLDQIYVLRDGTGIGVGAPQYGPRRGVYLGFTEHF